MDLRVVPNVFAEPRLIGKEIEPEGARKLVEVLKRMIFIEDVNLCGSLRIFNEWPERGGSSSPFFFVVNKLGPEGATALAPALAELKQLQKLEMSSSWRQLFGALVGVVDWTS